MIKFEDLYAKTKVFFMHEKKSDNRMKYFISTRKPIYIKDVFEPSEEKDKSDRIYYIDTLYNPTYALASAYLWKKWGRGKIYFFLFRTVVCLFTG
ncbi:MAG: hypothetical protein GY754_32900 [bacterium]|nr:hypothetical protein [bacterium]